MKNNVVSRAKDKLTNGYIKIKENPKVQRLSSAIFMMMVRVVSAKTAKTIKIKISGDKRVVQWISYETIKKERKNEYQNNKEQGKAGI